MCRWGFSNIVQILKDVRDDRVRAYIVWLPIFGGDFKGEARKLSDSFPDERISYVLDSESLTGGLWERILKTEKEIAWDVYLLYGADAHWEMEPPPPDFWMSNLSGVTKAPRLNRSEFTSKLNELLGRTLTGPKSRGGSDAPASAAVQLSQ
jgi:hypothetical protein